MGVGLNATRQTSCYSTNTRFGIGKAWKSFVVLPLGCLVERHARGQAKTEDYEPAIMGIAGSIHLISLFMAALANSPEALSW